ncbi:MAG: hypothetical protein CVV47_06975 [Spirochaetae bacterium HGW-Spirochaetae-3]|jgi:hypothetical protein|nr:MAG: hypothetical protein CVV47_06975 [Spirochaetae bacterium HGW-Spirochaetae-3]
MAGTRTKKSVESLEQKIEALTLEKARLAELNVEKEPMKAAYAEKKAQMKVLEGEMKMMRDEFKSKYKESLEPRGVKTV